MNTLYIFEFNDGHKKLNMTLQTALIYLRPIASTDLQNVFEGLSHPEVVRHYGVHFETIEETQEQMQWFQKLEENATGKWWAICSQENDQFLGAAGLNDIQIEHRKGEVGMWLLPRFWGQGILSQVMPLVLNYGFNKLNLHRIEGLVERDNVKCIKAIEKFGFQLEGEMRDYEIKDGEFINVRIYAKLRE